MIVADEYGQWEVEDNKPFTNRRMRVPTQKYIDENKGTKITVQTPSEPIIQPYETHIDLYRVALIHDSENNIYAKKYTAAGWAFEKSTNMGATWSTKSVLIADIRVAVKLKSGTILAIEKTAHESVSTTRLWRSTDDGITWEYVDAGLRFSPISAQGVVETQSGCVCIAEYGNVGNTVYRILRTMDDGLTWNTVLSSPGTDPSYDPGHFHSVTYDAYSNKLISFMDRPEASGGMIHVSSDEGATWDLIGCVNSVKKPNFVSPMFFETHIAWGYDNARNGVISRMTREDFYAGNFTEVEDIIQLNQKVFYYTFPIRKGVWLISMATETPGLKYFPDAPGGYDCEVFIVWDNGRRVSGGLSYYHTRATPFTMVGGKATFPSYVFNRLDHKGSSFINITTIYPRLESMLPYTQGYGLPTTRVMGLTQSIPNCLNTGTTANRPTSPHSGTLFFDETLGKPIWYKGNVWVDANGTTA